MNIYNISELPYKRLLGQYGPIHPSVIFGNNVRIGEGVVIEKGCMIGDNTLIGHHVILRPDTIIGNDCIVGHLSVCEGKTTLGNRVTVHDQSHLTMGITIEDDVFIAPCFCGANTPRITHGRNFPLVLESYRIKRAARLGIGVLLLPGVVIGENSLIGAGSIVTCDVPDKEIWFGCPAVKQGNVPHEEWL